MDGLESFYANLYDGSNCSLDSATSTFLDVITALFGIISFL